MSQPTYRRLDSALADLGLAPSRTKAQQMIEAGDVEVHVRGEWKVIQQASLMVEFSTEHIRVRPSSAILKYVSRGGLKLEGALQHLALDVSGMRCLDLGISTGGFADCLLAHGAGEICGIDVGHGQLHPSLAGKVTMIEGLNVRQAKENRELNDWLAGGEQLCVADVSFISLVSLLPQIKELLPDGCRFLGLIKPQFELGAAALNKAGVVTDPALYAPLEAQVRGELNVVDYFPSSLKGQDGNQEFFVFATIGR